MVWFARWRKKWKMIAIATATATLLGATATGIHEWRQYTQAKDAISQIVQLEKDIVQNEKQILRVYEELRNAKEYKSRAENSVKEGKIEEAKENYRFALSHFKAAEIWLYNTKIKRAGVNLERTKNSFTSNKYFDPRSNEVIAVEGSLKAAIKNVDELISSVSKEIKTIEGILSSF